MWAQQGTQTQAHNLLKEVSLDNENSMRMALTPTKHLPRARHGAKTLTCSLSLHSHDNPILGISILQMWKLRPRDVKSVTQGPQLASGGARIHTQAYNSRNRWVQIKCHAGMSGWGWGSGVQGGLWTQPDWGFKTALSLISQGPRGGSVVF